MTRRTRLALALFAPAVWSATALGQPLYECIIVDAFTPSYNLRETYLWDINEAGIAVGATTIENVLPGGSTSITYTGFYWEPGGQKTPIPLSWPRAVNAHGVIGGSNGIFDIASGAFTPAPGAAHPMEIFGINDSGLAVGYVQTCTCSNSQQLRQVPYAWDFATGVIPVSIPGAKEFMRVNNAGQAIGNIRGTGTPDGFVYDFANGQVTLLNALQGAGTTARLSDISQQGVVLGEGWNGSVNRAFTWSPAAGFTELPGLAGGQPGNVRPHGINASGAVVGNARPAQGGWTAFLWDPQNGMRNLNDLTNPPPGFVLTAASKINDQGWIVGWGQGGGGFVRSYVLKPLESACYPDCNADGALNLADFGCFQTKFALQDPYADCNADGQLNLADFGCFQTRFALGCP